MGTGSDEIEVFEEQEEDEVYVKYDIATYPSDLTLSGILELWNQDEIQIPEFQRDFVWKIKQSSLLIESFLLGLPVPPVFFYIDDANKNLVIDGQQRILSVIFYFEGYFGHAAGKSRRQIFRLKGLAENSPYNNLRYVDLPESDQRKLRNTVLRAVNIRQLSPDTNNTSIYHIFERLNTGGTALRPQEIRNCVYRGPILATLRDLNSDSNWRKIVGKIPPDKHQKDVELILRLFALFREWLRYEKPMKEYLNKVMSANKKFETTRAKDFARLFPEACKFVVDALGERPFNVRGPLNTTVLDATMTVVLEHIEKGLPAEFAEKFALMLEDREFEATTTLATTDTATVHHRLTMATNLLTK
ncbi:MAG: DUF262 domain-containing protein [Rhizomicrobium sp.]